MESLLKLPKFNITLTFKFCFMKKSHARKFLAVALLAVGFITYRASAQDTDLEEGEIIVPAANCHYTGNSSDECYASDGTRNLIVTNCRPGSTTCGYAALN